MTKIIINNITGTVPANGWVVGYRVLGSIGSYIEVSASSQPIAIITTDAPGTRYEGYVKSDCGNGIFSNSFMWSTPCVCDNGYGIYDDGTSVGCLRFDELPAFKSTDSTGTQYYSCAPGWALEGTGADSICYRQVTVPCFEICTAPTNVTATNPTLNTMDINWTSSATSNISYTLQYRAQNAPDWTSVSVGTTNFHQLTGLNSDTLYYVQVLTNCPSGVIVPSLPAAERTVGVCTYINSVDVTLSNQ